jgi:hypothetical protein
MSRYSKTGWSEKYDARPGDELGEGMMINELIASWILGMSKLFSDGEKRYLSRFLGGEILCPSTPFEARVFLERAAAVLDPEVPDARLVRAAFLLWADEIDPPCGVQSQGIN